MTVQDIVRLCESSSLRWTSHILGRLFERDIRLDDVKAVLEHGEIIEQYPTDCPLPSCLVLGYTTAGRPLHVVCGLDEVELWLITAYFPTPGEWTEDFRQRRNK
jgi:hypothetical protein